MRQLAAVHAMEIIPDDLLLDLGELLFGVEKIVVAEFIDALALRMPIFLRQETILILLGKSNAPFGVLLAAIFLGGGARLNCIVQAFSWSYRRRR